MASAFAALIQAPLIEIRALFIEMPASIKESLAESVCLSTIKVTDVNRSNVDLF